MQYALKNILFLLLKPILYYSRMKKLILLLVASISIFSSSNAQLAANDVELLNISTNIWARSGDNVQITGNFKTKGTQVLEYTTISWSANEGKEHSFVMQNRDY